MASLSEILVRVEGDVGDAESDLDSVAARLDKLDRKRAEATLSLDTDDFNRDMDETIARLDVIDGRDASADIHVDTGEANAELTALEARLDALDAKDVNVGVHINKDRVPNAPAIPNTGGSFSKASQETRIFGSTLSKLFLIAKVGIPVIVSLGSYLLALVSSLAMATAGAGALGISLGSLLIPAVVLGIGVLRRFKAQADQAGTAAHALQGTLTKFGKVYDKALGPGADRVLRGISGGLRSLLPTVASLRPAFTQFGGAVGSAFRTLGQEFSSPQWQQFFDFLIRSAAKVAPLVTQAFIGLSRTLAHIAQAAMPFLIDGFRSLAKYLTGLADKTSNIGELRDKIAGLVDHLRSWGDLLGNLGRVVAGFFKAAAPAGKTLVKQISKGADKLADWINSAKGQNAIKQFFDRVLPVAKDVFHIIGKLLKTFAKWSELTAPVLDPLLKIFGKVLDAVNKILDALNGLPEPLKDIAGAFALFGGAKLFGGLFKSIGKLATLLTGGRLTGAIATLGSKITGLGTKATTAFRLIATRAGLAGLAIGATFEAFTTDGGIIDDFKNAFNGQGGFFDGFDQEAHDWVENVKTQIAQAEKQITVALGKTATAGVKGLAGAANGAGKLLGRSIAQGGLGARGENNKAGQALGKAIFAGLKSGASGVRSAAASVAIGAAKAISGKSGATRSAGHLLGATAAAGMKAARGVAVGAGRVIGGAGATGEQATKGQHSNAGHTLGAALAAGLRGAGTAARSAAANVASGAAGAARAAASSFSGAGAAMGQSLADGIRSTISAVASAARDMAAAARNQFHGSEPKDPRSPLRNFPQAGKAMVEQLIVGISSAGSQIPAALSAELKPVKAVIPQAASGPQAVSHETTQNFHIPASPAAHGQPDPKHTAEMLAMLLRLQGAAA